MISREWVATYLATHLTRARSHTDMPVIPMAEEMTGELLEKWLEGEAVYWLTQSEQRGLTPGQRTLRIQVSRFYDSRLLAVRRQNRPEDDDTEGWVLS
jgi:hypothetical protein